jgi:leucyl aminopeptidase (aminopeptidase T)
VASAFGQQPNFEELAKRIVTTSANVKPGDVVMISGGKYNLALMEDLAIEANKVGGMTTMTISTDKVDRSFKAVIAGVPEARFAKAAKASQVITDALMNGPRLRYVFIGYPTKEDAASDHMDFDTYSAMHWNAVNAD